MSKKKRSNFKEQTVNDAKRQKASSYGYLNLPKGVKVLTLKERTREIRLDFIPYTVTDSQHPDRDVDANCAVVDVLWYKRPFKVHRNIGVNNDTFVCLTSSGKKCPICMWVADQKRKGTDWEDLKDTAAKDRNLYAVNPIDSKDHDEVIHVWDMSWFLFQNELNDQLEEYPDNGVFPALEEGLTLKVKFRWEKFGKNLFPKTRDIEFEDREKQYTEDILDEVPNLDEMLNVLSYEELDAKFLEMDDEEQTGDVYEEVDENEKPRYKKRETTTDEPKDVHEKEENPRQCAHRLREKPSTKDEEKKEKPRQRTRHTHAKSSPEEKEKEKCPHGHVFGKNCADYKDCDTCDSWDDCDEEQEKREKQQ